MPLNDHPFGIEIERVEQDILDHARGVQAG
jgi:hypothetical protein